MEPGQDVPDKVTSVQNNEVLPEMGPGPGEVSSIENKEVLPEMGPGPGEEAQVGKVCGFLSRVRLRTKTPDESCNRVWGKGGGGRESCRNEQQGARRCH